MGLWSPETGQDDIYVVLWFAQYLSTHDLVASLRNLTEVWIKNVPEHLMTQSTGDALSVHGKENISEVGREIQHRPADCCLFSVRPLTYARPPRQDGSCGAFHL